MTAPPRFDAPLTIGAQFDARAAHRDLARRIALVQGDRTWTYGRLRDEAVRTAFPAGTPASPVSDYLA